MTDSSVVATTTTTLPTIFGQTSFDIMWWCLTGMACMLVLRAAMNEFEISRGLLPSQVKQWKWLMRQ